MDQQVSNILEIVGISIFFISIFLYYLNKLSKHKNTLYVYRGLSKKDKLLFWPVKSNGKKFMFLIDTGCTHSLINKEVADKMNCTLYGICSDSQEGIITLNSLTEETFIKCNAEADVSFRIGSISSTHRMLVIDQLPVDGILGMDILNKLRARIEIRTGKISVRIK